MTSSTTRTDPADEAAVMPQHCFDPALASGRTITVPIGAVVDLLQVTHAPDRIAEYRRAMLRGDRFPPIAVVVMGGRVLVADGHKRFTAYRALPVVDIVVEVWTIRRWLGDQWRQLRGKTRQQWRLVSRVAVDPGARRELNRLFRDTIGHWRRIAVSLADRLRKPGVR